ncbi:hypothetical protein JK207_07655 [Gluconobacter cerinus]|uniref:hypothetical protein n=1 Tax=Gluconobacter cerinus TaxID=38307 RepID=UPI001B8CC78A|nr:hypothetical protein [Gluconobacter cerinus]MBS1021906.1 hypothetical protein [Gluconobacter cerinus]
MTKKISTTVEEKINRGIKKIAENAPKTPIDISEVEIIELKARTLILENSVKYLASKLGDDEREGFISFLDNRAEISDRVNTSLVGHKRSRIEEYSHQINLAARAMAQRSITKPEPEND